jgi:type I restriction-modification system DNA methylase subunit
MKWSDQLLDSSDNIADPKNACYTPFEIAIKMAKELDWKPGQTILDPCVGKGALLAACLDTYPDLKEEDCYGIDVDLNSIEFCRNYFPNAHFQVGDALKDNYTEEGFWEKPYNILYSEYLIDHPKPFKEIWGKPNT